MRTTARLATIAALAAVLVACGETRAERPDTLFLQSRRGVTIVPAGATSPSFRAPSALPSHDWSKIVQTERAGDDTRLVGLHSSTKIELWSQVVPGNLRLQAVSRDADAAVLEPAGSRYASNPRVTKFVIARRGADTEIIKLDGNFAPEAFSTDGTSLFVVQYFPARNPNRYQVRRLDLNTGEVNDVYSVDAELQKSMRGTARVQAMSPDGARLYTLYTLKRDGRSYAFVHVLSLAEDELWAHCIDLPASFSQSAQSATALTLAPDGGRLYVANAHADAVVEVDTETLAVTRTGTVDLDEGERAYATYGADSTLFVASGWKVLAIGVRDLKVVRSWKMLLPATGIQGGGGSKLYVGQAQRIAILDRSSGKRLGEVDPPGIGTISRLGKVMRGLGSVRTEIVCAC